MDDIKVAGKKQNMASMWKKLMKNVDLDEPTSFLDHVYLGYTQRECKPKETIIEQFTQMFEFRISAGATEKLPGPEKLHAKNRGLVLRHGRTCSKMRSAVLRTDKQNSRAAFQSFKSLRGRLSIQTRRT